MARFIAQIEKALERMDTSLAAQRNRMGALQRDLDHHAQELDQLALRIDASMDRLQALLGSP